MEEELVRPEPETPPRPDEARPRRRHRLPPREPRRPAPEPPEAREAEETRRPTEQPPAAERAASERSDRDRLEHSLTPGERARGDEAAAPHAALRRYEELEVIGTGGSGVVTLAQDRHTGERVAIKRLRRDAAGRGQAERFLREAAAIRCLDHPNVVRLHEVIAAEEDGAGEAGAVALVLELVEGPTLEQLVREQGRLPLAQALEVAVGVADGLAHAHAQGVIHRDVKPSNVLLTPEGRPKLVDFGLALPVEAQLSLTQTGAALGTVDTMAPEQWDRPHEVDGRADVYSLGATLYRLVTGSSPRVIREGRIPEPIRPLVLRCVEERPQDRFADMAALVQALGRALARALADSSGVHAPLARVARQLRGEIEQAHRTGGARRLQVAALGLQTLGLLSPAAVRDLDARLTVGSPLDAELPRVVDAVLEEAARRGAERPRLLSDAYAVLLASQARAKLGAASQEALARLEAASREPVRSAPASRLAEALGRLTREQLLEPDLLRQLVGAQVDSQAALERVLRALRQRGSASSPAEWLVEQARWRRALETLAAALPEPELAALLRRERTALELEGAARRAAQLQASENADADGNGDGDGDGDGG